MRYLKFAFDTAKYFLLGLIFVGLAGLSLIGISTLLCLFGKTSLSEAAAFIALTLILAHMGHIRR